MEIKLYSIFDKKTAVYQPPIFCHNQGHAQRHIIDVFTGKNYTVSKFPEDFTLYEVGEFNDVTGVLNAYITPQHVCEISTLIKKAKDGEETVQVFDKDYR